MKNGTPPPVESSSNPHSAWKRALETTTPSDSKAGRGANGPSGEGRGTNTAYFRQNVLDFFHDMYGTTPLDGPASKKVAGGSDGGKKAAVAPQAPARENCASRKGGPALRRANSHHGTGTNTPSILQRGAAGKSFSEDHLDTLLDHIIQGYKQTGSQTRGPLQPSVNRPEGNDVVSFFVSRALKNYLVKEASFSLNDAQSANSILSFGGDANFQKLLTFQTQSQIVFPDEDESDAFEKPKLDGGMAMFNSVHTRSAMSVSKPMPMTLLPPGDIGKVPSQSLSTMKPVQQDETLLDFPQAAKEPPKPRSFMANNMSLDSGKLRTESIDSWGESVGEGMKEMHSISNARGESINTKDPVVVAAPSSRPPLREMNAAVARDPAKPGKETIEQLIHEEELMRSVLMTVENRFRTYLGSLNADAVEELKSTATTVMKGKNAPLKASKQQLETTKSKEPMVQNLLDFFSK